MAVRVGQASIDERGKTKGGQAGNQSKKELNIRDWYSKPWQFVLRHPSPIIRELLAEACESGVRNLNIGYDQNQRNTLHTQLLANNYDMSAVGKCETDCSAFMTACAICAGVRDLEYSGNAPTTATMKQTFSKAGFTVLTNARYLKSSDYLLRGDILVRASSHTVMALDNGFQMCPCPFEEPTALIKFNSKGNGAKWVQFMLNKFGYDLAVDGVFGAKSLKALKDFQKKNALVVDGECGVKTRAKLKA